MDKVQDQIPEDAPRNKKSNTTVQEGFNETINNTFAYVATIHIVYMETSL